MGNLFSNLLGETPASAPSASYTVTPASSSTSSTTTSTNETTTTSTTSTNNSSPGVVCSPGTVATTTTTTTSNATSTSPPAGPPVQTSNSEFSEFMNDIFNATTYTILFWIVVMYIVYSFGVDIFKNKGATNETSGVSSYSRTIDIVLMFLIFAFCFQYYYNLDTEDKENMVGWSLKFTEQYFDNPWNLFYLIWFTIIFFTLVYILRVPMEPNVKPVLVQLVEHKIWIIYAMVFVVFFFKYILNIPIISLIFNNSIVKYFENVPPFSSPGVFVELDDSIDELLGVAPSPETSTTTTSDSTQQNCKSAKQVFNLANNIYSYEDAQKVCAAFDASLATYDQVETAYNNGAEWCNYGWSEGQMAYFPTQKDTWDRLQKNPNTKHACGRPGINGGYIDNPYVKFGANCYGVKPPKPDGWSPSASFEECEVNPVDEEMEKLKNMAKINNFNQKKWSRY